MLFTQQSAKVVLSSGLFEIQIAILEASTFSPIAEAQEVLGSFTTTTVVRRFERSKLAEVAKLQRWLIATSGKFLASR
jgi:hypothetical protein